MTKSRFLTDNNKIVVEKTWRQLQVYHRQPFHTELPTLLSNIFANPDAALARGDLLKDGDKTTLAKITQGKITLVIKRYNTLNVWHALLFCLRTSRAHRCWVYAHVFKESGLDTPEPVAMIEQRFGPIKRRAYYIMQYRHGDPGRTIILQASAQELKRYLDAMANDLARLHRKLITHGDLKDSNWLWDENRWVWLDLDSARQHTQLRSFTITWFRDMRRLLRNWQHRPDILQLAKRVIPWTANF